MDIKLGLDTFGDNTVNEDGRPVAPAQTIRDVVEQARLADELKIDSFGIGEHHRDDYAVSAPDTVLAGIATVTGNIKLTTAVTVLSSDDPVRVYERFATLQALSNGRAEIIAGRGSFIESFPLFGYSLQDYEILYSEKLELLKQLLQNQPVTWTGETRASLTNQMVYPPTETPVPLKVAVGGTPSSVIRAAVNELPVTFAIIGGVPGRFKPLVDLYRDTLATHSSASPEIGVHSMGHVAETDEKAQVEFFPHYQKFHNKLGAERGWGTLSRDQYLHEVKHGSLYVGSPETVAAKILSTVKTLEVGQFDLKYATGTMPHSMLMNSIRLFGEEVLPAVQSA